MGKMLKPLVPVPAEDNDQVSLDFLMTNGRRFPRVYAALDSIPGYYGYAIEVDDVGGIGVLIFMPSTRLAQLKETK